MVSDLMWKGVWSEMWCGVDWRNVVFKKSVDVFCNILCDTL